MVGKQVLNISLAESTMDEVKELAKLGAREGLVVIADNQSRGRGRFNREWLTTSGQDLTISILFQPALNQVHMLNMVASLAIQETISDITQNENKITLFFTYDLEAAKIPIKNLLGNNFHIGNKQIIFSVKSNVNLFNLIEKTLRQLLELIHDLETKSATDSVMQS